jgi:hypothetical protein
MKRLKQEIIDSLLKDEQLQIELAGAMEVEKTAIYQSLKNSRGRSIVKSYVGAHLLMKKYKLKYAQLTEELDAE